MGGESRSDFVPSSFTLFNVFCLLSWRYLNDIVYHDLQLKTQEQMDKITEDIHNVDGETLKKLLENMENFYALYWKKKVNILNN